MSKPFGISLVFVFSLTLFMATLDVGQTWAEPQGWSQTYGDIGGESAYALVITSDGGYALAGTTDSFGAGSDDFWLVKTDENGNAEWNQTYGGTSSDQASALVQTSDGGYALAGYTLSFGLAGNYDFWLVKTDENGEVRWNKTYGREHGDWASALLQTSDGGYALAGCTYPWGSMYPTDDFWLVKTDANGNTNWTKSYGGTNFEWAHALVQTEDGGYALAGDSYSINVPDSDDFWVVKTYENGNANWTKKYGGPSNDCAYSLIETDDGGYVIAGSTYSFGAGSSDFYLVKIDSQGNLQWEKTYGGVAEDEAYSVVQTSDGGYAMGGRSRSVGSEDFWLVKTDVNGNAEWNKTYGGTGRDLAHVLAPSSDGGYALAGVTESYGAGGSDFWLLKTDGNGVVPEFPSTLILPLFIITTLLAVIVCRRKHCEQGE